MAGLGRGIYVLPNLFTSANLFLGFYAIIRAVQITMEGHNTFQECAIAIIFAAIADMLDGRVANMTKTASKFGVEYDSISDMVSFGVAPALVMFLWSLSSFGRIGWIACFLYVGCTALRLARYNVQVGFVEKSHFQGIPSPMAAFMLCGLMLIFNGEKLEELSLPYIGTIKYYVLALVILLALLMVSKVPYRNFRSLFLKKRLPFYVLLIIILGIMFVALKPLWATFVIGLIYVLSGVTVLILKMILPKSLRKKYLQG
ncbi:MAG: CDP-diacylglycerol--serine O-phosphatidyltransferase [Bdellovibrionales bacterium]|nr:CDP-diacylglycerol--serine O-phosphatidyltransferase [Bdellovibrionales bacterium]